MQAKLLDDKSILVKVAPDDARYADMLRKLQGGAGTDEQEADGDDTHEDIQPIADSEETSERGEEPSESADEDTKDLAEFYANHWNHMAAAGMEPNEESLWDAEDELEGGEWSVYLDEDDGTWKVAHISTFDVPRVRHDRSGQPLRYAWVDHGHSATGKKRWKNSETGRIAYQEKKPGDKSGRSKVLREGPGEPRPEGALSAKDKKAAEKSLEALKKASKGGAKAKLGKMASELRTAAQTIPASKVRDRKRIEKQIKMVEHQLELLGGAKATEAVAPVAVAAASTQSDAIDTAKLAARANLLAEAALIVGKSVKAMVKYSDEQLQAIIDANRKGDDHEQHTEPVGSKSVEGDRGGDGSAGSGSVLPAGNAAAAPGISDAGTQGGTRASGDAEGLPPGEVGNGPVGVDADGGRRDVVGDGGGTGDRADVADAGSGGGGPIGNGRAVAGDDELPEESVADVIQSVPTADNPNDTAAGNFRYPPHIEYGGDKAKFQANIAAIETLRKIKEEGRTHATAEEQEVLSKWVGWGQLKHVFNTWQSRKNWEKEIAQVQALLSEEESDSAFSSTQNAHYTHPDVVKLHWDIAKRLGFKGGRFLETSAGIGYYLGMMPKDLAGKTQTTAVEKDLLTGAMLEKLYPKAAVSVTPFEKFGAPDNFYDLVASNVPFGAVNVFDPKYKKYGAHIHDYFLLKSLDAAAEGGLVMHITSTGTMDKANDSIRRALAEKGDLVAAIRFPGKTHKENAGTEVVTDMLIFRKRPAGEVQLTMEETPPREAIPKDPLFSGITTDSLGRVYHWKDGKRIPGPQWMETAMMPSAPGEEPAYVNKHFLDHPEWVLGTLDRTGKMRGFGEKGVSIVTEQELSQATGREVVRTPDRQNFVYADDNSRVDAETVSRVGDEVYSKRLARAFEMLPKNVMKYKKKAKAEKELIRMPAPGDVKEGGMFIKDGKVFVKNGSEATESDVSAKHATHVKAILNLRDVLRASYLKQSRGEDAAEERASLNKTYDAYVKKHGFINADATKKLFKDDPDYFMLAAIEKWDSKTKTATKEAAFKEDTVRANKVVTSAKSTADSMNICLQQIGSLDVDHMAALTGFSAERIEKELRDQELAFNDPSSGWTLKAQYLSGNVRRKLVEAKAAAVSDERYAVNVAALERVQPADIPYDDIQVKLGAPWVPPSDIKQFLASHMQTQASNFDVEHADLTGWKCSYSDDASWFKKSARAAKYSVRRSGSGRLAYSYPDLVELVMKQKAPMVTSTDAEGNKVVDWEANEKAERIMDDIREKFDEWVWRDPERRTRLHRYYNDNFNNIVRPKYDGSYLTLPGSNPTINLRPHQKNFVAQVVATGNALAAHEVGTGKSFSLMASAMELRRLGLANKPALVCLKANVEAMTKDAMKLYPNAKILSTVGSFDAKSRQATIAKIAAGDWDMVILTHDHLGKIKMRPETQQKFIQEQIDELGGALEIARINDPTGRSDTVADLARRRDELQAQFDDLINDAAKDDAVFFEELGIDALFVDESHKFKSLPIISTMGAVKGIPTSDSQRAVNLKMMADWTRQRNNGRGLVFATGTPISNTMAELYTQQKFLQPEEMKERGIYEFDAWANTFGNITTEFEFNVAGGFKEATRFRSYVNPKELVDIVSQVMDSQRAEMLLKADGSAEIVRPPRKDEIVTSPQTESVKALIDELSGRAASLTRDRKKDNMFMICSDGRKGSIDMRMIQADAIDEPTSKVNKCVENVIRQYNAHPETTQMIFSDIGAHPMKNGFHLYADIIKKLTDAGVKEDEIANFAEMTDKQKESAQELMRQGKIRIAIGTTEKMGTGVNVQNRLGFIHHIDAPWTPSAMEQRNGRGWRQGNENSTGSINIFTYVTEKSLDSMMWQTLLRKEKFIKQIMLPDAVLAREIEDEDTETFSADQILALATGDDRVLEKVIIEKEIKKLERRRKSFNQEVTELTVKAQTLTKDVEHMKRKSEEWDAYANMVDGLSAKPFSMEINGVEFDKLEDADSVFTETVKAAKSSYTDKKIATYKGLEIRGSANRVYIRVPQELGGGVYPLDGVDTARQLGGEIGHIIGRRKRHYERIAEMEASVAVVKEEIAKMGEFPHEALLKEKRDRSAEITLTLANKEKKPPVDLDGDDGDGDEVSPGPRSTLGWNMSPDIRPIDNEPDRYARDERDAYEFVVGRQSYTELIRYQRRMRVEAASAQGE